MRISTVVLYGFFTGLASSISCQPREQHHSARLMPRTSNEPGTSNKAAAKKPLTDSESKALYNLEPSSSSSSSVKSKLDTLRLTSRTRSPKAGPSRSSPLAPGPSSPQSEVSFFQTDSRSRSPSPSAKTQTARSSQMPVQEASRQALRPGGTPFMRTAALRSQTYRPTLRGQKKSIPQEPLDPISLANSGHGRQSAMAFAEGPAVMEAGVLGKPPRTKIVLPGRVGIISAHHDDKTVWASSKVGKGASTVAAAHGEGIFAEAHPGYAGSGWIRTLGPEDHETYQTVPGGRKGEENWEVKNPAKASISGTVGIEGPGQAVVGGLNKAHVTVTDPNKKHDVRYY